MSCHIVFCYGMLHYSKLTLYDVVLMLCAAIQYYVMMSYAMLCHAGWATGIFFPSAVDGTSNCRNGPAVWSDLHPKSYESFSQGTCGPPSPIILGTCSITTTTTNDNHDNDRFDTIDSHNASNY